MTADLHTSTLDGAAAFERGRAWSDYDPSDYYDGPTRAEADREAADAFFDSIDAQPWKPNPAAGREAA